MPFPAMWKPQFDAPYTKDSFFKNDPRFSAKKGQMRDIPLIIGFNKDEGLVTTSHWFKNPLLFERFQYDFMTKNMTISNNDYIQQ